MERAPSKRALSPCDGHHDVGFLVLAVSRFTAWDIAAHSADVCALGAASQ
jgi:hypothetical protein